MHTLVIQLGRLGDVIQTTPLLRELAARQTGDRMDLLLLHPNQASILGMEGVATVRTVRENLKLLDDRIAAGFTKGAIPAEAPRLLQELKLPRYDRIINASHAALGCWLAGEISGHAREGGVISRGGECLYEGAAHTYRVAMLGFREQNWFNIVDLIRCAATRRTVPAMHSRLYVNISPGLPFALPPGRKVAVNPGASEGQRRWPAAHFARLAEELSAGGLVPILVGTSSDREACADVRAASKVTLPDVAGKTSIPEMARVLAESELLVSADTGAVHAAAAVGTKVLGLYGATAYFAETSPWGKGHLLLQAPLGSSLSELTPEVVLAGALNRLGLLDKAGLCRELQQRGTAAWETDFLPANADPLGGLCYWPVHQASLSVADLFTHALRHVFAREWCGGEGSVSLDWVEDRLGRTAQGGTGDFATHAAGLREKVRSLALILEQMHRAAAACEKTSERRDAQACSNISAIVHVLTQGLDALKAVAAKKDWAMFCPVVHYLDWRLRMMPPLPPRETFGYHAREYRTVANMLREAASLMSQLKSRPTSGLTSSFVRSNQDAEESR